MPNREPLDNFRYRVLTGEVQSETNPNQSYQVQLPHCTCPDFQYRDAATEPHLCKHILGLYNQVHGWRPAPQPNTVTTQ